MYCYSATFTYFAWGPPAAVSAPRCWPSSRTPACMHSPKWMLYICSCSWQVRWRIGGVCCPGALPCHPGALPCHPGALPAVFVTPWQQCASSERCAIQAFVYISGVVEIECCLGEEVGRSRTRV
jgi:hypothetical protein